MAPDAVSIPATQTYSLEAFPAAAAWLDHSGAVREANRLWRRLLGDQAIGQPFVERLHPEDGERVRRGLGLVQVGGLSPTFRVRVAVDGGWAPYTLRARADGGIGGMGLGAGWLIHLHPCEGQGEAVVSLAAGNGALAFAHEVAVDLLQELDPQRLLARALDGLVAALPVRAAFIPVLDRQERMAAVVAVAGRGLESLRGRRIEVVGGVCGRLDEIGRARFVAAGDPLFTDDPLFPEGPPPEGLLLAPLHYEDRVLGGICAVPRAGRPEAVDSLLLESVELLARLVCGTLQSARRFDRVRQASDHHERLLSVLPDPLWIIGPDDVVEECNTPASQLMGNDCVGQAVNTVFCEGAGGEICAAIAAVQAGTAARADLRVSLVRDSRPLTALVAVLPLAPRESGRVVVFARDITQLLAIEEEREQMRAATTEAARLAAVGELATGMAHEINNPLMGIINYADLARDEVPVDSTMRQWMDVIISEGERIAELLRHLRALGRSDGMAVEPTALADTVAAALSLVGHGLGRDGIDVALDLPPTLPPVLVVPYQLQQAIIALISNACWAIAERRLPCTTDSRGWIGIHAEPAMEGDRRGVRLTVADNGVGIDGQDLPRVFDPFFTRRTGRSGLGLGLTRVRKDVAGWGGQIHAGQRQEGGAVVTLWIPTQAMEEPCT
jgi:signal transduction histidine kinase